MLVQTKTLHDSKSPKQQKLKLFDAQKQHGQKQQRKHVANLPKGALHSRQPSHQTVNVRAAVGPAPPPFVHFQAAPHTQTSYIIRKDIKSFNFSDIEINEEDATAAARLDELARRSRNGELLHDLWQRAVTATPQPPITELDDIFISVKTTKNYHDTRLALIIKTWFQLARDQVSANAIERPAWCTDC